MTRQLRPQRAAALKAKKRIQNLYSPSSAQTFALVPVPKQTQGYLPTNMPTTYFWKQVLKYLVLFMIGVAYSALCVILFTFYGKVISSICNSALEYIHQTAYDSVQDIVLPSYYV